MVVEHVTRLNLYALVAKTGLLPRKCAHHVTQIGSARPSKTPVGERANS